MCYHNFVVNAQTPQCELQDVFGELNGLGSSDTPSDLGQHGSEVHLSDGYPKVVFQSNLIFAK